MRLESKNRRGIFALAAAISICLFGATSLWAQSSTATILGTVTDASGAVVAGASVDVKNVGTGTSQLSETDSQGRFRVPELKVGDYEVHASRQGFQTVVRKGITLTVGIEAVVDVTLPVGQSQQTVTVDAQPSQVDTSSVALGSLVDEKQIRELPLNGRNFQDLMALAPGVQVLPATGGTQYGNQPNYSVSGSRPTGQTMLIDNANFAGYSDHGTGSAAAGTSLGIEAIGEFQTLTNTYSAQFGGNGAIINAVTRSGTNALRGSAYEFLRNSVFDARNFFDNFIKPGATTAAVPSFRRNQFGGSLGGPIRKDKTFFFVNYEGLRQSLGQTSTANVPDANAQKGFLPCNVATTFKCDSSTGLANVGINPIIAPLLPLFPAATTPLGNGVGTATQVRAAITNEDYVLTRLDHNFSAKDSIFVRWVRDKANINLPFASTPIPLYPELDFSNNNYVTVEERHIISPTLVNLARFSFLRPTEGAQPPNTIPALQYFPGTGRPDGRVSVTSLSTLGPVQDDPYYYIVNHFTEGDDVIWTRGAHSVRFGITIDRAQENQAASGGAGGAWTFTSLQNFLLGTSSQFQAPIIGQQDTTRDIRETYVKPYVHDEWKVTRRLTLNIGLRYEWEANPTERNNKLHNLINRPFGSYVTVPNVFQTNPTTKNFEPRFGFAYDVTGDHKTAVRGGFGIYHDVWVARTFAAYLRSYPYNNSIQTFPTYPTPFLGGTTPVIPSANSNWDYTISKTPYMMQYNLNIQRDLGGGFVLTTGYVGSRGVNLLSSRDTNPPIPTVGANGQPVFASLIGGKIVTNARVNPAYSFLVARQDWGSSNYNSLQTSLVRRFSRSWQAQAAYTYSKSMDYASASSNPENSGGTALTQNPYDIRDEYGRSNFDRTHALRVSGIYEMPAFANHITNTLLGGWQASSVMNFASGEPFTAFVGFDQAGLQTGNVQRPNLIAGNSPDPILGTPAQWFNPKAFSLPAVGTVGNLGRNTLVGPSLATIDVSMTRTIRLQRISEHTDMQFRAEAFNLFNHANFGLPSQGVFVAGANGTGTYDATSGRITSTVNSSRQLQLALKFHF